MTWKSPVYGVRAVPIEKIRPNEYNPNSVAPPEMRLLYDSIKQDGYTMPIVCFYDASADMYDIVDGFHRYRVMLEHSDIREREDGMLPVSVIDKPLDERMASTIRHNRARGTHDVDLMGNIVSELHKIGRSDTWIAKHLGMDQDEILRLKQITGLAELFKDEASFPRMCGGDPACSTRRVSGRCYLYFIRCDLPGIAVWRKVGTDTGSLSGRRGQQLYSRCHRRRKCGEADRSTPAKTAR